MKKDYACGFCYPLLFLSPRPSDQHRTIVWFYTRTRRSFKKRRRTAAVCRQAIRFRTFCPANITEECLFRKTEAYTLEVVAKIHQMDFIVLMDMKGSDWPTQMKRRSANILKAVYEARYRENPQCPTILVKAPFSRSLRGFVPVFENDQQIGDALTKLDSLTPLVEKFTPAIHDRTAGQHRRRIDRRIDRRVHLKYTAQPIWSQKRSLVCRRNGNAMPLRDQRRGGGWPSIPTINASI